MGKIKKILENELVGGTQTTDVYPVTSTKAVYDENNERLDNILNRRKLGITYDVSALNNGAVFESLSALLSDDNLSTLIPISVRHGGMSIRFIQGSSGNNKYVQYMLMSETFSTISTNWQGVDDEPTAGSDNLVKSGGVNKKIYDIRQIIGVPINVTRRVETVGLPYIFNFGVTIKSGDKFTIKLIANGVLSPEASKYCAIYGNTDSYLVATLSEGQTKTVTATQDISLFRFYASTNSLISAGNVTIEITNINGITEQVDNLNTKYGNLVTSVQTTNKEIFYKVIDGTGIIGADGKKINQSSNTGFFYSKYIRAIVGVIIRAYAYGNYLNYAFFYDANLNLVGTLAAQSEGWQDITLSSGNIPSSAVYMRCNILPPVLQVWNIITLEPEIKVGLSTKVDKEPNMIFKDRLIASSSNSIWGWENGICQGTDGSIYYGYGSSFKYNTVLIPINPQNEYYISHREPAETLYFYDIKENYIGYLKPTRAEDSSIIFTSPENAYFIRYSYAVLPFAVYMLYKGEFSTTEIKQLDRKIGQLQLNSPSEFNILACPTIYGRRFTKNDEFYKFNNFVYAEGFVKDNTRRLTIDGGRESRVNPNNTNNTSVSIQLKSEEGLIKNINISTIGVNPSSINGKAFVLIIGESTTAAVEPDPYKGNVGSWGWPSALRQYSMFDQVDNVGMDVVTIGTRGNYNRHITYKNTDLTIRSFNEGIPGWPSYCVLNWPCFAKFSLGDANADGFSARNMWYALGLASKTPYNASSYNSDREEYTGSAAQLTLMTQTPFGKYKVDGYSTTWALMQYLSGREYNDGTYPIFEDTTSTYNGSASQITMMQNFCDSLANNPMNRFYSLTEARSGSTGTAFSLDTYLSRYRTLDDAGNRLEGSAGETVVGGDGNTYTIGTKVSNTSNYDVCTPTHVILNVGINDSENNYVANAVANIKTLVGLFTQPIAYFLTRMTGVCNLGDWGDVAIPARYVPFSFNVVMLDNLKGWFDEQAGKYLLPIYAIQYPCSVTEEFLEETVDGKQIVNCKAANIHPGLFAYRSIGFQCLSWLYYTKSIE